jgi:acetolactate synthase-1/2/3 large subunit
MMSDASQESVRVAHNGILERSMNGADVVAEILKREGTEMLSCYPRNPLIDAAAKIDVRPILCRQERVGVGIADGFTRVMRGRRNGVFVSQQGPGAENAFPGVAQAFAENVPMLVIPAGYALKQQYNHPIFRSAEVFRPVTKWAALAHHVQELPDLFRRAYQIMRSGKGGPVLVEVPTEVFEAEFTGVLDYRPVEPIRMAPDPDAVKRAAAMLLAVRNPVIWAGQGVHYADASPQLVALAELLPAPVACTNPGKSAIAETHPLALGASTRNQPRMYTAFMEKADLVFAIGSSLSRTSFGPALPFGKTIIHSTNDPNDVNKDIRCDLGLAGDAQLVLDALIAEVARQKGRSDGARMSDLSTQIAAMKAEWLKDWEHQLGSEEVPINQYRVIRELMNAVDRDETIITHDSGSPRKQLLPFWETTRAGTYLGWGKTTQLGHGLGLAMGAKIAAPEKLCINVMGDAAIGMTGMDLETAARNGIAILTIVFNNSVMAAERDVMQTSTEKYNAIDVGGNYAKLADALDVSSARVDKPSHVAGAIRDAIAVTQKGKPFLLEFVVKEGYDFT